MDQTIYKPSSSKMSTTSLWASYRSLTPMILVNGMAEQAETWFANRGNWARSFDVMIPELLVYNSEELHRHIETHGEVTVDYLTERLATYLDQFVQRPPYYLVGSSLGGQVVLTYATRYPDKVAKFVLMCMPGAYGSECLPVVEGVRRSQYDLLVGSVFFEREFAAQEMVENYERKFQDRKWRKGMLRTVRGTAGHSIAHLFEKVTKPALLIWGADDQILTDVPGAVRTANRIPGVRQVVLPRCGHAPQIEKARQVNAMVREFWLDTNFAVPPSIDADRFLQRHQSTPTEEISL